MAIPTDCRGYVLPSLDILTDVLILMSQIVAKQSVGRLMAVTSLRLVPSFTMKHHMAKRYRAAMCHLQRYMGLCLQMVSETSK